MSLKRTSCAYCGVGCGVMIASPSDEENGGSSAPHLSLRGDPEHPANWGDLCAKGERLLDSLPLPSRLLYPQQRATKALSWSDAITLIADTFSQTIIEHGPGSVAFYLSGQLLTEDYYVANKLAKGFIGTPNVDTNSRLCMSSAVSAHIRAFGEDVVPGCYQDFELADVVVLVGANSAWTHPVLFKRMLAARASHGCKIVVIDPLSSASAKRADLHLALRPGTDSTLFAGLLVHLADNDLLDNAFIDGHSDGFYPALTRARAIAPSIERVAGVCGLSPAAVAQFYRWYQPSLNTVTASCQGVNQSISGTDCTNAIINVHLALGQVGRAGAGFFSLTGQPNAMGGREVGGLATQLACHLGFSAPERQIVQDFWQAPALVDGAGLTAVELFDAIEQGDIKALWILGTNPVVSLPDSAKIARALEACPFVVVSDITADTDTAQYADVLLPAQGWGEKSGTVTNSERCISRQRSVVTAKGQAKSDWWALCQVAKAMGFIGFDYDNSAAIFREFAGLSKVVNQAFPAKQFSIAAFADITDIEYDALVPTQWPVHHKAQIGQQHQRVFTHQRFATETGRAQFVCASEGSSHNAAGILNTHGDHHPLEELATDGRSQGLYLNSGRSRDQWHTMTRTGHIASLRAAQTEPTVFIHPDTARDLGIENAGFLRIARVGEPITDKRQLDMIPASADGVAADSVIGRAQFDDSLPPHLLNMPMHWSQQFSLTGGVNLALDSRWDPISKQPAFKCQRVDVSAVSIPWQGIVFGAVVNPANEGIGQRTFPNALWQVQQTLTTGECIYLGFSSQVLALQSLNFERSLSWHYGSHQISCSLSQGKLVALCILAEHAIEIDVAVVASLIGEPMVPALVKRLHQLLLAGNSQIICACTGVTASQINDAVNQIIQQTRAQGASTSLSANAFDDETIDKVQQRLGCGRQCGSCYSEVQTEVRAQISHCRKQQVHPAEEVA